MSNIILDIPKRKTGEEIVKKLMSKPGIEKVELLENKVKITYDRYSVIPLNIERWVKETKVLPYIFG